MENKETKKGFWATLFAPKQKSSCCCGSQVEEVKEKGSSCCCGSDQSVTDVKEVMVLGPGCAKCKDAFKVVEKVIKESGLDVKLSKVEDIVEMMNYNIMSTPAVVVDGKVVIKGHVPSEDEVKKALGL